jgi:hypothetical protein
MSDELKDFRYYADKAEETLAVLPELQSNEGKRNAIAKAQVYATLAKAAPRVGDADDVEFCGSNFAWSGVTYVCSLKTEDHPKYHFNGSQGVVWLDEEAAMSPGAVN